MNKMKKTFMIALTGLMMFAFSQCGDNNGSKKEGEETNKGTKEYVTWKKAYEEAIKIVKDIKDCMDVYKAQDKIEGILKEADHDSDPHYYEEKERMTDKEREELLKLEKELGKLFEEKAAGCD